MKTDELKELLKKFGSNIVYSADLKKKNRLNIGGKAKVFLKENELTDLVNFLKILNNKEKIKIIRSRSNKLIKNKVNKREIVKDVKK